MEEAEILCDRLAIMDHGRILEMGTVDELVSKRFQERAVRFDRARGPRPRPSSQALPAVDLGQGRRDEVARSTRGTSARRSGRCWRLAEARGLEPQNLAIRRATLEDVFLDLTGRALRD